MPTGHIIERMLRAPLVWDGAMGTMIYSHGVFLNRCFDDMCLGRPDLILDIHRAYVRAGADVIETNSFGANRIWLGGYGLADRTVDINHAAAALARDAAGDAVFVAGSVGPCLRAGEQMLTPENRNSVYDAFVECTQALAEGGVDCILLETFSSIEELLLAARAAAGTELPVVASFAVDLEGNTAQGASAENLVSRLDACPEIDAIGMNCGIGPGPMYTVARRAMPLTAKPFLLMPNAGQPEQVAGRMLYLATPEYFTEYAKRYIEIGARGVGGCCGTTPDHIREMARAVHAMSGVKRHIEIPTARPETIAVQPIPLADKSLVGRKLAAGEKVLSVEVLPPHSCDLAPLLEKVRQCRDAGIDAINIPDGPRASVRISPMITAVAIRQQVGIEPILHYCCRDRNLIGMQSDLLGSYAAGVSNILIITGDPPKLGNYPDATGVFDVDAIGLTRVAHNLNHGFDVGGNAIDPPCGLVIGVGVNPCAVDPKRELERFRQKIEAGAEYAITQPVFDAEALERFFDSVSGFPKSIPVIAGIWPLVSLRNAEFMKNEVPGVEVPDRIIERMRRCTTREDGLKQGVEIARDIRDTVADRVAGFQVSAPFGRVEIAIDVLKG
jgi:methionine synthase I (cobalamin-dependent)/5,10-methylenetetrahydrofolate reductase